MASELRVNDEDLKSTTLSSQNEFGISIKKINKKSGTQVSAKPLSHGMKSRIVLPNKCNSAYSRLCDTPQLAVQSPTVSREISATINATSSAPSMIESTIAQPPYNMSPAPEPSASTGHTHEHKHKHYEAITIGSAVGGALLVILVVLCILRRKITKTKDKQNENIEAFSNVNDLLTLRKYSHAEIKRMTKSFKDKIGQGGFGTVYKGELPDGRHVAVKLLNDSKSNGEDFINELSSISRTSHVNIVPLLGFSYYPKRVLIYEFMPNGSLDKLIYNNVTHSHLGWRMLYEISVGIARGLEYLHQGCNTRILHFDIKPHNILLDENFCAKISDFGLAKLGKSDQSVVSTLAGPRGTVGYIAPEVCSNHFGRVSYKSDVYSYGMMVLEMVGGRRNIDPHASQTSKIYFPHYVFKRIVAVGEDLGLGEFSNNREDEEIAKKMAIVSLWCIQTNPSDRPSMSGVLEMLQGTLQSLRFPPNPFVNSPPASP